jgi:uncharacterized MnhB-related membrane protein
VSETLILHSSWWLDLPLSLILLWVAWRLLATPDPHQAVILFITFGLILALVWVRLDAIDVALAEAAIGSGLTGAILWSALARMRDKGDVRTGSGHQEMENEDEAGR